MSEQPNFRACLVCGATVTGRHRKAGAPEYCSGRCKKRAYRQKRAQGHTGTPEAFVTVRAVTGGRISVTGDLAPASGNGDAGANGDGAANGDAGAVIVRAIDRTTIEAGLRAKGTPERDLQREADYVERFLRDEQTGAWGRDRQTFI